MSTKFTPGPWRAALYLGGTYYITDAPIYEPRGRAIAEVFGTINPLVAAGANARLIAAAPELYEALREVAAMLDALLQERPALAAWTCGTTTLGNHRAAVRAALSKADGQ